MNHTIHHTAPREVASTTRRRHRTRVLVVPAIAAASFAATSGSVAA